MSEQHPVFTAVQEDATSFCMDWPVFENDESSESHFKGTVFVLDAAGSRICDAPLAAPSNRSADEALNRVGWTRCGAWHRDSFGRQAARVMAVGAYSSSQPQGEGSARIGSARIGSARIGSLAEEAALHLA